MLKQAKRYAVKFWDLLRAAFIEYEHDRAKYLGIAMIYYALVSLVPFIALLMSALGLLLRFSSAAAEFRQKVMASLEANFGARLHEMIEPLLNTLEQQSIIATVISLAGLLLTASVLFHNLRQGFRAIWKYDPPLVSGPLHVVVRTTIRERVISITMVLGGGALLVGALGLNAAIQAVDSLLRSVPGFDQATGWSLGALSSFIVDTITFALLLKFLPPVPIRFRDVWPAALLCAFSWVAANQALALYGVLFGTSGSAYGAIGGLLALLLWMKVVSQILFFGAEMCKVAALRADTSPSSIGSVGTRVP